MTPLPRPSQPGEAAFDLWSWVHFGSGLALGVVVQSWWLALAALGGFEVAEAVLRRVRRHGRGLFEHESWANIAADILVGAAGWAASAWLLPWPGAWRLA